MPRVAVTVPHGQLRPLINLAVDPTIITLKEPRTTAIVGLPQKTAHRMATAALKITLEIASVTSNSCHCFGDHFVRSLITLASFLVAHAKK